MEEKQPQKRPKSYIVSIILFIVMIILVVVLVWCWWWRPHDAPVADTPSGGTGTTSTAAGPCTGGEANPTPAGFTVYENTTLGYKFAYPSSWGTVAVTTTPIASETGDYVMGRFSANDKVWFGGNATDYVFRGRDGIPTDYPGYLKASSRYYTVVISRFNDGSTTENRHTLQPIEPTHEERAGCNTIALVTQFDASELSSIGPADIAHFNLQSTNRYYGVNFVMDKPTDALRADFHKLIRSFQLIP